MAVEVYELGCGTYRRIAPDTHGVVRAPRLGLTLHPIDGPQLRITRSDGSVVDIASLAAARRS